MRMYHLWLELLLVSVVPSSVHSFVSTDNVVTPDEQDEQLFPPVIDSDDISYFFSTYDLEGLHWAATNIFRRSVRNPNVSSAAELPSILVARGGGDSYTTEYKLKHDLSQAEYLVKLLEHSDPHTASYLQSTVIPIYRDVLKNIPPLDELAKTQGLYAFTDLDYELGIGDVYNKMLYSTTSDELDPGWRQLAEKRNGLLNPRDWEAIQQSWFGAKGNGNESAKNDAKLEQQNDNLHSSTPGVLVIDDLLSPQTLDIIRKLLLRNTHWYQTKMPLKFGKYVGSYIDDGLNDPVFLELAKQLHQAMPRVMKGHDLRYMWAYKYDSEWSSGINLHADQAAVNVNMWVSLNDSNLDESSGGLVVYTTKPPGELLHNLSFLSIFGHLSHTSSQTTMGS